MAPAFRPGCRPSAGAGVGAHPPAAVLDREHLGVEVGGPLPAVLGQRQVAQRVADVGLDLVPEEARVGLGQVGRRAVAEPGRRPGLDELVEQRRLLPEVAGSASCPIRSAARTSPASVPVASWSPSSGTGKRVSSIAAATRSGSTAPMTSARSRTKSGAVDVVGGEEGVRRAARQRQPGPGEVDHDLGRGVAAAGAADVADVVAEEGHRHVQPVPGREPLRDLAPAQDRGPDQRHHHGVLDVVVERVREGDPLEPQARRGRDRRPVVRPALAEDAPVLVRQVPAHRLDDQSRRVEHAPLPANPPVIRPCPGARHPPGTRSAGRGLSERLYGGGKTER